jgi:predicted PhzF superfamily epimerase YddE/YHI9
MWEDPASGTSSAGLGMYLVNHGITGTGSLIMEQGNDTSNLSRVFLEIDDSDRAEDKIWVGGLAMTSMSKSIIIEGDSVKIS